MTKKNVLKSFIPAKKVKTYISSCFQNPKQIFEPNLLPNLSLWEVRVIFTEIEFIFRIMTLKGVLTN